MKSWESEIQQILGWLSGLEPGERAQLRRCHSLGDVLCTPPFGRLLAVMDKTDADFLPGMATIAGVLVHAKNRDGYLAGALAERLSERRFARLLACENHDDELFRHWRRAVGLAGEVPLRELAVTVYFWNEQTRARLAQNFYRSK